ncbi:hypothetical protein ACLOJK_030119 [Asimina triloba]
MAGDKMPSSSSAPQSSVSPYEEALDSLSSLIIRRTRADASNKGDRFDIMVDYLKMLDLEYPVSNWKAEKTNEDVPMPTYFRFIALLAFKIFTEEQVDVAILEVGLGGKYDATNVVQEPVVCGVSSLGYDHMEILGRYHSNMAVWPDRQRHFPDIKLPSSLRNTLGEIAGEKAGIFKPGVPAFTVPQPPEAMAALENRASQLGVMNGVLLCLSSEVNVLYADQITLKVVPPLDIHLLNGQKLGLDGEHQYLNAGLAVSLCYTWLQKNGHMEAIYPDQNGRAQIVPDPHTNMQHKDDPCFGGLVFFLDGAHSPESMEMCAQWFSSAIKEDIQKKNSLELHHINRMMQNNTCEGTKIESPWKKSRQILLFNCMPVRDPHRLLPRLINACAQHGIHFHKALFVPNQSVFNKVGTHALPSSDTEIDVLWQQTLQRVWENLIHGKKGNDGKAGDSKPESGKDTEPSNMMDHESSTVFPSLTLAIKWIRDSVEMNQSIRFQCVWIHCSRDRIVAPCWGCLEVSQEVKGICIAPLPDVLTEGGFVACI